MILLGKRIALANEINLCLDKSVQAFVREAVSILPDAFFEKSASSSGNHHPQYALGRGGLLRHTKAAVAIASTLLHLDMYSHFTSIERDMIIASLILHDGLKYGDRGGLITLSDHPALCVQWLKAQPALRNIISQDHSDIICGAIAAHMGQWSDLKPSTPLQGFVHQADFLASRQWIGINFEFLSN